MSDVTHVPSEGLYIFHTTSGCIIDSWVVDGKQVHVAQTEYKQASETGTYEDIKARHTTLLVAKVKETNNGRDPSS